MDYCEECGCELGEWCLMCDAPYCPGCDSLHSDCAEPGDEDSDDEDFQRMPEVR